MASLIIHRLEYLDCEPWSDQEFLRLESIIYNCGEALYNLLRDINHTVFPPRAGLRPLPLEVLIAHF